MKVILAEKPSVAREIAAFVGARTRHDAYLEGGGYQVTWAYGHLVELKEPEDYDPALKRWSLETLPFIPERFELKLVKDKRSRQQFNVIKRLFRSADEIICATDAGREGELIFRYILAMTGCEKKPFRRLWLSSLTPAAIREAFRRLRPGSDYDRLYAAARCRSEADWIVGLNATRNYTVRYGVQRIAVERGPRPDTGVGHDRRTGRRDPHVQDGAVLGTDDPLSGRGLQVSRRPFLAESRCGIAAGAGPGPSVYGHQGRSQGRTEPAAAAVRFDRTAADDEPPLRPVGGRHSQGSPGAVRGQADHLSANRLAVPEQRHENADPGHLATAAGLTDPGKSTGWIWTRCLSPAASSTTARSPTTTRSSRPATCRRTCRRPSSESSTPS